MIFAFIKSTVIILGIAFLGAFILALCSAGADEEGVSRSILYDDPEYFKCDEPEWLRKEDEDEKDN